MKVYVPCRTLDEAEARIKEDPDFAIDSVYNEDEFSNYTMAMVVDMFDPREYPYIVWKDLEYC